MVLRIPLRFRCNSTIQFLPRRTLFTSKPPPPPNRLRTAASTTLFLVSGGLFTVYYFDCDSAIHRYFSTPLLRLALDAETAHKVAVQVLRSGLGPKDWSTDDERLKTKLWDEELSNPIGLAAGFDKNGEAIDGLFDLGFGWVEIGSVTPKPQPGNPQPRVFTLPSDSAVINRYGFPSDGAMAVLFRLRARIPSFPSITPAQNPKESHASLKPKALLAVNLGKNKSSPPDSIDDFVTGINMFGTYADVLVVNVSSPNTPGLRGLQGRGMLEELIPILTKARDELPLSLLTYRRPKLVLKIAPDLDENAIRGVAEAIRNTGGIDAVIVSNTTIQRPESLTHVNKAEAGGLSGPPLKPYALRALSILRQNLPASIPLIGCGGISSGADALEYAKAGASAVQIYTQFGYDGVGACSRIKQELSRELMKEGVTWDAVVRDAVARLSLKPETKTRRKLKIAASAPAKAVSVTVQTGEEGVAALIRSAEEIGRQLDELAKRIPVLVATQP